MYYPSVASQVFTLRLNLVSWNAGYLVHRHALKIPILVRNCGNQDPCLNWIS